MVADQAMGRPQIVADVPPRSTLRNVSNSDYRYVVSRTRLKFGERAFSVAAPSIEPAANRTQCVPRQSSSIPCKRSCSRLLTVAGSRIALLNWTV